MKNKIKEHISFTLKMLNPVGTICLIFGILYIFVGIVKDNLVVTIIGVFLMLHSTLLYEMNWNFDKLKNETKQNK